LGLSFGNVLPVTRSNVDTAFHMGAGKKFFTSIRLEAMTWLS
jgi:hypothetical protein